MRSRSLLLVLLALAACAPRATTAPGAPTSGAATSGAPTPPSAEMRGVWIATVSNIDWPSVASRGDSARQKTELRTLLDRAAADGMNAVILQVRSGADALYTSRLEPWAGLLTGTPGTDPGWDPLAFAIDEAHARGLELHAWFNPYRAGSARDSLALPANHVFRTNRDLVRVYGGALWMDPGDPAVPERTLAAMTDVVRRYDVDGVHIDDFFYPYPQYDSTRKAIDFPDSATWAAHNPRNLSRADWRRDNVNRFVERMYAEVHRVKPWVKVGISPFGIWRPGTPAQIKGLDPVESIYADSRVWLQRGWLDYFVPQLYWAIDPPAQSFTALLDWWTQPEQNPLGRPVWPGLASYRVDTTALRPDSATLPRIADSATFSYRPDEILRQVRETRARASRHASGVVFYNGSSVLVRAGGAMGQRVRDSLFTAPALVPPMPWLGGGAPGRPTVATIADTTVDGAAAVVARVAPAGGEPSRWWAVSWRVNGAWTPAERAWGGARSLVRRGGADGVAVWGVSRTGVLGEAALVGR
ncbi:glycoside hydrolase family 10 protein [Gemmatirosa kalamazoonensis]|nr:family 10 glycosylhydrolase [Gemmatirosa kalamazoonensis]